MRKYSCLHALGLSFFSADLYRDVAKNWGANVVFYLMLLVAICTAFQVVAIQHDINANFDGAAGTYMDKLALQFPQITLKKDGTIETPENRPYIIYDPDDKQILMVIDTSGHYTSLEKQPFDMLVTKTHYMDRKKSGEIQMHPWPTDLEYVMHPEVVKQVAKEWSAKAWILIYPFMLIFLFIWRLFVAAFYAVFGLLMTKITDGELSYYAVFNLTIVALTPAMMINTILYLINFTFPHETLFFFILTMAYLYFGIRANKNIS